MGNPLCGACNYSDFLHFSGDICVVLIGSTVKILKHRKLKQKSILFNIHFLHLWIWLQFFFKIYNSTGGTRKMFWFIRKANEWEILFANNRTSPAQRSRSVCWQIWAGSLSASHRYLSSWELILQPENDMSTRNFWFFFTHICLNVRIWAHIIQGWKRRSPCQVEFLRRSAGRSREVEDFSTGAGPWSHNSFCVVLFSVASEIEPSSRSPEAYTRDEM